MDIQLYLTPFLKAFVITIVLSIVLTWCSKKIACRGREDSRHIHLKKISRLGGVAIIVAFLISILTDANLVISQPLWGIMIASFFILLVGLWDDFSELDWKYQFFYQVAIVILIFITGTQVEYITNPFGGYIFLDLGQYLLPSLLFVIVWVVLMMNSMNWLDGIDGLSGGAAFVGAITIFLLSMKPEVNQPPVGIISMALAGAVLAFLIFNFHPARILAGTTGSMFMGFILAVLAIFAGIKIATALLVMAIPIADTLWVVWERFRSGDAVHEPDERHLHYKLMKLGWSQKKIALFFYVITILIAIVALNTRAMGKSITIILVVAIMIGVILVVNKKIAAKEQKLSK
ncbi:putative undecaprenyl-phosphate N-acetylglucosaminyl 1-phosphate transferase [bacterium BMS3Abin15]|nr:putative undecaprenyl-phosphate N-acetylglucosaminyl 1-phosphate transferase [bacterium BMS3Abin15]HDZ85650.1 undecaprenyl/decaprenyl-phosphate alpha-N-acetylglucosaminyl 1-phosphate transferase [Candidatus Moranbacteria bacterium]